MKQKLFIFILQMLCCFASSYAQSLDDFTISMKAKCFLRVVNETSARVKFKVDIFNAFPRNEYVEIEDSAAQSVILTLPIRTAQNVYLNFQNRQYKLFVLPSDTLTVHVLFSDSTQTKVRFSGKYGYLQDYDNAKFEYFKQQDLILIKGKSCREAKTLHEYQSLMDSLQKQEIVFFEQYQKSHKLPTWFIENEQNDMIYTDAALRYSTVFYRRFTNRGLAEPIPENYFDFLKKATIDNPKACHLGTYWMFVLDYISSEPKKLNEKNTEEWRKAIETVDEQTYRQVLDFAKLSLNPASYKLYQFMDLSLWIKQDPERIKNRLKSFAELKNHPLGLYLLEQAERNTFILKQGDVAPNFVLVNEQDSLVSLKDFEGQIVYLCFWFPGCQPCIQAIPDENKLVEKYKGKSVKIISICTHTSQKKWLEAIKKYNIKALNLYANENWQKDLEKKYNIQAYGHNVLIDRQRKIIKNYAPKPKDIESLIRGLDK